MVKFAKKPGFIVAGLIWALLFFFAYPLVLLLLKGFGLPGHLTLEPYRDLLWNPLGWEALRNSLVVGATTMLLSLVLGATLAWLATRSDIPGRRFLRIMVFLTFATPPYIGTLGWIQALGHSGWLNLLLMRAFGLARPPIEIYSLPGIAVVMSLHLYPLVFWATEGMLLRLDPVYEEEAALLGAGRGKIFFKVVLPMILPALLSSGLLVFMHSLSCFAVAAELGLPRRRYLLVTLVYSTLSHYDVKGACALSAVLVALSGGASLLRRSLLGNADASVRAETGRARVMELGALRMPVGILALTFTAVVALLPLLSLVGTSLTRAWGLPLGPRNLTLANYLELLRNLLVARAIRNSLAFACLAACIGTLLSLGIGYLAERTRLRGRKTLELVTTLPLAIPGPVLALAIILAFIHSPLPLYNTPWIIVLGYTVAFTPIALLTVSGGLRAVDGELEEAAWTMGASRLQGLQKVLFPLLRKEILAGWILIFLMTLREIPLSLMLHTRGTETVGVILFSFRDTLGVEVTAALAVVVMVITLVGRLWVTGIERQLWEKRGV
ncbi:MAG TPA: iron ABC transporter permease [Chloroflexi bacterium]|nr:iron ABC transporter permease [Chloroflexota bacterium]